MDIGQTRAVGHAAGDAASAKSQVEHMAMRVSALEARADRVGLVCQALWELIRERTDLTDADIYAKMHEVDARDGTVDGRIRYAIENCPNCGRPRSRKHANCMYCGAALARENLVE
ncbi:MAG: hypothetical protein QM758_11940 [Armatimonas sp.]